MHVSIDLEQEDNSFAVSTRESGPSARPLTGKWWGDYEVKKVMFANKPDGSRKVAA